MDTETGLYTASEARERLGGLASSSFHQLVLRGRIRKVTAPGRKQGLYVREDVEAVAEEMRSAGLLRRSGAGSPVAPDARPAIAVDWMLGTDLPAILALDMEVYQEELIGDIATYYAWWKKNPRTTLVAFDAADRGNILAQACLLPVPEEIILSVLRGERKETSITAEEVETYDRPGEYNLLAESIISHPDHRPYLGAIMHRFAEFWCDMWPDRRMRRIYAQAVSTEGRYFVQKLYFGPLYDLADNAFVLDLRYPNPSKVIQAYQRCIEEKQRLPI